MLKTLKTNQIKLNPTTAIALTLSAAVLGFVIYATFAASATGTISGTAYQDTNRNGIQDEGEEPFADHVIYLFDSSGAWVASRRTDADGRYVFSDLPAGTYDVKYERTSWGAIWSDWVPTTTGTIYPDQSVTLSSTGWTADFGWRPITWSTDVDSPISHVVGAEGLTVQSYNDVITAQEVYDYIIDNFLVSDEAPTTTVRFAYDSFNQAQTSISQKDGVVTDVRTTAYASYETMLNRDNHRTLAHEYGHAWMNYHNYFVQQDINNEWAAFLTARGIDPGDDRLGSSHAWRPSEIAADDYRQLFTTEPTSSIGHMNRDIPDAWDVDGLETFLREEFTQPPPEDPDPSDTTAPSVSLTNPADDSTVSGTVPITANASDNVGVSKVEFYRGTTLLGSDTSSPYSYSWDTTTTANGSHSLTAKATDAAGNSKTSDSVTVTVSNQIAKQGDINQDGKVDVFDLSIMLDNWDTSDSGSDLNNDGTVNVFDLSILLDNWGS